MRQFNVKTVLMIADRMLYRVEYFYSKNYIHGDIKPDNCLIGDTAGSNFVHMVGFGLAKKCRGWTAQQHIPYRDGKGLTGTAAYASINAHPGIEQSRPDDLEAVGYVLMYLDRGQLPWQGCRAATNSDRYRKIMGCEVPASLETLCKRDTRRSLPRTSPIATPCDLFMREGCSRKRRFDWSPRSQDCRRPCPAARRLRRCGRRRRRAHCRTKQALAVPVQVTVLLLGKTFGDGVSSEVAIALEAPLLCPGLHASRSSRHHEF
ncbi:unnamed protein product [Prorocentrum cordatum]|uniref:Casein kinase I n=1 Tax=Prorocentrum cordatum TaxID=2364126 RepID=A0ABN9SIG1_9DINO|nr:unnamed protein product [Polarella glacialis]